MNQNSAASKAFSLVEVTLALGVAAFCLVAVFGLLPIGAQTHRSAIAQTAAISILSSAVADLRATPITNSTSPQYGITLGTPATLYFDGDGKFVTATVANFRYRLTVTFPASSTGSLAPTFAYLKVTWPAAADPAAANGSTETFAAFDRH